MTQTIIGIDISKDVLDVATWPDDNWQQFGNDKAGHKALCKLLNQKDIDLVVFEATGAYHRDLERCLANAQLPYAKVNPKQARDFANACGQLAKTDKVDAVLLARFGLVMQPQHSIVKSEVIEKLHDLTTARAALIKDRTAAKNRTHIVRHSLLRKQLAQRLRQIEADIAAIDAACRAIIKEDEALTRRCDILLSIPGVGEATAFTLLSEMPELGSMDKRQTAALAGLAPITRQSGKWKGKSFIGKGRKNLRQALYMPALVATRHNIVLKQTYQAHIKRGKPAKVALTAIMRKLIIIANALIRDDRIWE